MAAFLAVFPDLFDRHLLLIDLVDDRTRILHFRKRGLFHAAGIAVVKSRDINNVALALLINLKGGVLSPGPVKLALALAAAALDLAAVGIDRRQHLLCPAFFPAFRRGENPFHLFVTANLNNGGLVPRADNDRIIFRIVVD